MQRLRPASPALAAILAVAACAAPPRPTPPAGTPADRPVAPEAGRPRPRDLGIAIGALPPGRWNAITDVGGVHVGHATVLDGDGVRTGVTVVLPHAENPVRVRVPAAVVVGNGYGKLVGATQIAELGELESPIALTGTLNVHRVADALVTWLLELPGNGGLRSVNAVVGETNDGRLSDIRARPVTAAHVGAALAAAATGPVAGGSVGAGTGTVCFGWKGGIGTSSRRVGPYTVGVLVQSNFGGRLTVAGVPVHEALQPPRLDAPAGGGRDGSCMVVVATDAPLAERNLRRLAARALAGMARTGASFANGSGDYVIAFSNAPALRRRSTADAATAGAATLRNDRTTPLFVAAADATEEAILDSLLRATTVTGYRGHRAEALPIEPLRRLLDAARQR